MADLAKHSRLDDAQESVEYLQSQLRAFRTELADVTISADFQVNIDGFLRFADYVFDGIFADWAVLDRLLKREFGWMEMLDPGLVYETKVLAKAQLAEG